MSSINAPAGAVAQVRIIDSTTKISNMKSTYLMGPPVKGFDHFPTIPSWSFLVESPTSGKKALFDLGVKRDWANLAPITSNRLKTNGWSIEVEKEVVEILEENSVSASEINSIIWSHWHWDHIGDPSTFPSTTELVVGPGFKDTFLPGYPGREDAPVREKDFAGRAVREISFNDKKSLTLGRFRAVDFFGDGSFYLLDTPGHAVGHLSGLARTTSDPDTFIFMGGDICHHGGELRPSEQIPIPAEIKPHPWNRRFSSLCPGAVLEKTQIERGRSANEPFFEPTMGLSVPEAIRSIRKAQEIDAEENVLFVFAHEASIRSVADFFPASANDWKQKGWREQTLWAFLKDFQQILETDC